MQEIIYDIHSGKPLILGFAGEQNSRKAILEGFEQKEQGSAILINIKGIGSRPLTNFVFPATYTYTKKEGTYEAYLAEVITNSDDEITYERHSKNFDLIIKHSAPLEDEATPSTDTFSDWSAEITGAIADLNARADRGDFDGDPGADGFSPTVSISKNGTTTTITIVDKNGTHTATITDGQNGQNGTPGANGSDGISPTVSVSKAGKVTTVTITDKNGTHTATINDGEDATLTSQAIIDALAYTPAKQSDVEAIQNMSEGSVTKQLNEDIASKLSEPNSGLAVGKYFKVSAIDADGHAVLEACDLPIATTTKVGLLMSDTGAGLDVGSGGYLRGGTLSNTSYNNRGNIAVISKGTLENIKTSLVGRALADDTAEAYSVETQNKALARLNAEKAKGEWVLKGTLTTENKASGVAVDLSGCTELTVKGTITTTATTSIKRASNATFITGMPVGTITIFVVVGNGKFGFVPNTYNYISGNNSYVESNSFLRMFTNLNGVYVSNLQNFTFSDSNLVTSCNLEFYAR